MCSVAMWYCFKRLCHVDPNVPIKGLCQVWFFFTRVARFFGATGSNHLLTFIKLFLQGFLRTNVVQRLIQKKKQCIVVTTF